MLYSEDGGIEPTAGPQDPDRIAAAEVAGGRVLAVVPDGSGGWFIGGDFDFVQGTLTRGLAHLDPNGSLDTDWDASATGGLRKVNALAVSAGTVYVGGDFTTVDGQPRSNIAALDAGDGSLRSWDPGANSSVESLAVSGSVVYAGGAFSGSNSIGGEDRNHIAAIDATNGVVDPAWAPSADGVVQALAVDATSGKLFAGGSFSQIDNGVDSAGPNLVSIDVVSGAVDPSWDPEPNGVVQALMLHNGSLYVGGTFDGTGSIAGVDRDYLAELDASSAAATGWDPNPNGSVRALARSQDGSFIYAGGDFAGPGSIGGAARNHLAALDASTGNAGPWNPNTDSPALALAAAGGHVYAGGGFGSAGPNLVERDNIARLNPNGSVDTAWNPGAGGAIAPEVDALLFSGGSLYVGGSFDTLDGTSRSNLGALDAATGNVDPAWVPSADDQMLSLALSDDGGTVYTGGYFLTLSDGTNTVGPYLGSVSTTTGEVGAAWDPAPDHSPVSALAASGTSVYAGGGFGHLGGQDRIGLAALDPGTGDALAGAGWEPPSGAFPFGPDALALDSGNLYVGGSFTGIAGAGRNGIAALDPDSGVPTPWDPDLQRRRPRPRGVERDGLRGRPVRVRQRLRGPVPPRPRGDRRRHWVRDRLEPVPQRGRRRPRALSGWEHPLRGRRVHHRRRVCDHLLLEDRRHRDRLLAHAVRQGLRQSRGRRAVSSADVHDQQRRRRGPRVQRRLGHRHRRGPVSDPRGPVHRDRGPRRQLHGAGLLQPDHRGPQDRQPRFTDNANGSPHDLPLAGNGTTALSGPAAALSPPSFSFGSRGTGDVLGAAGVHAHQQR